MVFSSRIGTDNLSLQNHFQIKRNFSLVEQSGLVENLVGFFIFVLGEKKKKIGGREHEDRTMRGKKIYFDILKFPLLKSPKYPSQQVT